ncbi:patatin-like phospholipase family protein [uncultured Polaribacter sp.]|uniref:patatin-like phospholipase family protein n=1 Tax=uncultured Polaribacter sp. TaxID=174711 RepID=UPI00261F36E5|nr:patatin-like phospholipase family protein [uncultured Polaribacter sp.]
MHPITKLGTLFLILFYSLVLRAQKQPKVGLVLSGGGAKGFAHVGILKEIDKAGLHLDYIGGTSMGAVVGGLYAYGYNADQIEQIITTTDFANLMRDLLPRSSNTFFEKEYGENTIVTLPLNKGKIDLPKGISKGQNVLNLLLELIDTNSSTKDFSKLQTPFFCIATDIENGAQIVLEKGSLPMALRASGSIPSILNPIEIDNKLLIDGGVANNFPVSVMKNKGIDIIIGVDVEGKLYQKENINSLVAILNQVVSYKMYNKTEQERKKLDVYIHPDIYKFDASDFDKKDEIMQKGFEKAREYKAVFKEIAKKQGVKKARKKIDFDAKKTLISAINITGVKNYSRAYTLGKLNIKVGDSLSKQELTEKVYLLSATRNYTTINYNLMPNKDGSCTLNFSLLESNERSNLKLGLHYDYLYKSGFLVNYNHKRLLSKNDALSLNVVLGDNIRYDLNYFVDNGFYYSYGFRSRYNQFKAQVPFNDIRLPDINSLSLNYRDFTNQFFVQTTFKRRFAVGVKTEIQRIRAITENIIEENDQNISDNSTYFNAAAFLKLDTYNKRYFATKGFYLDLEFKWFIASSDFANNFKNYPQAKGTFGFAIPISKNLTIQNTNAAGFSLEEVPSDVFDFYLGGNNQNYINNFVSFYGYEFATLSDDSFIKSEFDLRYEFLPKHYFSFIANYARVNDNVFKNFNLFNQIKSGYAVGYSYNSFIGPIELKYSWSPDVKNSATFLFNLGFWF